MNDRFTRDYIVHQPYELSPPAQIHSSTMSTKANPPSEEATKRRIITHMNNDHQDSLIRYLEHYSHLSSFSVRHASLTDISFSSLHIHTPPSFPFLTSGSSHTIPITPKLESWADARPRVVAMDQEATVGLRRNPITVKKYAPPHGWMTVVMLACALTFICFSYGGNFLPGSFFYETFYLSAVPRFARLCHVIQVPLMAIMLVLHSGEAWWMLRTRLRTHTVPTGSRLWWTWMGSVFVEGMGAFVRFDALIREEEERRAKVKH